MNGEAVRKSLNRTRSRIREKNMPLRVPFAMQSRERLASVHQVLYLMFTEGYSATRGAELLRRDLCLEALRQVAALLQQPDIANGATHALYALMLFTVARFDARTDSEGGMIELARQDRSLWDRKVIQSGISHFLVAKKDNLWGRYHYEAAILSLHATAAHFHETDWEAIVRLYDAYLQVDNSPFVRLNRALALHFGGNTATALKEAKQLDELKDHLQYLISMAELHKAIGDKDTATNYCLEGLKKAHNDRTREALEKELRALSGIS
ncbi:DUF6596 domain-containing protein [Roseivirga sp. BDSF3-8]|uniref:DUF6596 domain-containing protein n=1 Tax=Roseivirga sp. BDSF3-8 TaxID=3241598 RepID=UPI003531F745